MTEVTGLLLTPNSWESLPSPQPNCPLASPVSAPYTGGSYSFSLGQICSLRWGTNALESAAVPFPIPSHRHPPGNQGLRKFLYSANTAQGHGSHGVGSRIHLVGRKGRIHSPQPPQTMMKKSPHSEQEPLPLPATGWEGDHCPQAPVLPWGWGGQAAVLQLDMIAVTAPSWSL